MKRKVLSVILAGAMVAGLAGTVTVHAEDQKTYNIGICQLVQHVALDAATQGFEDALKAELGDAVDIKVQNASNDIPTCSTIVSGFVAEGVDLIMANATPALQAAAAATQEIPILGTSITEYGVALDIQDFNGTVGGNISGTADLAPLDQQAAMFAELQHAPVDSAMFYDGRCGVSMFSSLFNPLTEAPFPAYYAFLAFNVLYRLGQEVAVYTEQMWEAGQADAALRVLAARGEKDGAARGAVLICNPTGTSLPLELNANGRLTSCSVLTEDGLAEIPLPAELESGAVLLAEYAL